MAEENLLYLDLVELDDGKVLRGGALAVDTTTEPLEFRCTSAVRPTKLQKILWGSRLHDYIAIDLVAQPLLKAITATYAAVLVQEEQLLGLASRIDIPVVRLTRDATIEFENLDEAAANTEQDETAGSQASHNPNDAAANAILTNPAGKYEQVVLRTAPGHKHQLSAARALLTPVFRTRDVMEPFARIAAALDVVHKQEQPKEER